MATSRRDDLDIPDLDVPLAPSSGPAPAREPSRAEPPARSGPLQAAPGSQTASPLDYFGSATFDADDFQQSATPIALAETAGSPPSEHGMAGAAGFEGGNWEADFDLLDDSAAPRLAEPLAPARSRWPTGDSPNTATLVPDRSEVERLAGYGPPPDSALKCPVYAARVLRRKRELKAAVAERRRRLEETERQRDEQLARLAETLRPALEADTSLRPLLARVESAEGQLSSERQALAGEHADFDRRHQAALHQIAEADRVLAARQSDLGNARAVLEQRKTAFERMEAKKKRLFIELSPLVDRSEKAGGPSAEQAAKIAELEAAVFALEPHRAQASAAADQAGAAVEQAERAVEQARREREAADRGRRALERHGKQQLGARSAHVERAAVDRCVALADVARAALRTRGAIAVDETTLDALIETDDAVARDALELELHLHALDADDTAAVRRGIVLGAAALLVAALALFALTRL